MLSCHTLGDGVRSRVAQSAYRATVAHGSASTRHPCSPTSLPGNLRDSPPLVPSVLTIIMRSECWHTGGTSLGSTTVRARKVNWRRGRGRQPMRSTAAWSPRERSQTGFVPTPLPARVAELLSRRVPSPALAASRRRRAGARARRRRRLAVRLRWPVRAPTAAAASTWRAARRASRAAKGASRGRARADRSAGVRPRARRRARRAAAAA